jgi:hypothetical protein
VFFVQNVNKSYFIKKVRFFLGPPLTSLSMLYSLMLQAMVVGCIMNDYERCLKWHCLPSLIDLVKLYRLGSVETAGEI